MPRKKKTASPDAPKPQTKTSFVLSLPDETPVKEVSAKAKAAGIEITEKHVSAIRSTAKKKGKKKKGAPKRRAGRPKGSKNRTSVAVQKPTTPTRGATSGAGAETTFRKLVLELGIGRSRSILSELERGLAALIGG